MFCDGVGVDRTAHLMGRVPRHRVRSTGHLNAANYRYLSLIAEFDNLQGWSDGSTSSCAHWLSWQCGIDMGAAREKVRVAHGLEKLPRIAAAMACGQLSYSKVRALTRVACENTEEYFLSIALHGTAAHVEKVVRYYRRAKESEEQSREAQQQASRLVSYCYDTDGSMILKARLPAETGALVLKALDAATKDVSAETSAPESSQERLSFGARRADALGRLAESFLSHGAEALNGGDRYQIVVHVDAETLQEGCAGRCEFDDGPSLAVETARRLACDASLVAVLEDEDGEPLNVGRKTRSIPPALRRALNARDRGCRFPGCPNTHFVDAHHIHHWAKGGETKLSNLVQLCRFHHRQVHEGGVVAQTLDDGAVRFVKPNGESFESIAPDHTRPLSDWHQLVEDHTQQNIRIDKNTAATRWRGERMDYDLGVAVLVQQSHRPRRVSAETSCRSGNS